MTRLMLMAILGLVASDLCAQAGVVGFATGGVNPLSRAENNGPAVFWVRRSSGSTGVVTVNYATNGGTATPDVDYVSVSGTLVWVNGDTADKSFTVPLINDSDEESSETIRVEISNPTGGLGLAPNDDWTMNLLDDDALSTGGGGDGGDDKNDSGSCSARGHSPAVPGMFVGALVLFACTRRLKKFVLLVSLCLAPAGLSAQTGLPQGAAADLHSLPSPEVLQFSTQQGFWNAVAVGAQNSGSPTAGIEIDGVISTAGPGCAFVLSNGHLGAISASSGNAFLPLGGSFQNASAIHARRAVAVAGGSPSVAFLALDSVYAPSGTETGEFVHVWEVNISPGSEGVRDVKMNKEGSLTGWRWAVFAPGTNSSWRTRADRTYGEFLLSATNDANEPINFNSAGYWCIVAFCERTDFCDGGGAFSAQVSNVPSGGNGGGGGGGGDDKDDSGCVADASHSWFPLLALFGVAFLIHLRRRAFLPVIVIAGSVLVLACSSTHVGSETIRTARDLPAPAGFPNEGWAGDSFVCAAKLTNTFAANSEAEKVFTVHNERNSPGVSNRAWFSLPETGDRKIAKAELYLARVKRRGDFQPQVSVYDVNLLIERETNFFGATTRLNRVEEPARLVKEDFKFAPLEDAGIDPKTTNPRTDNIPVTSHGDYDTIDLTAIIQASYTRADRELVIQFNYNLDDNAPTVGGFNSDAKRCAIMWARTGPATPRLKVTYATKASDTPPANIDDEVEELRKMKERGLLTEDEYLEQKAALFKKSK